MLECDYIQGALLPDSPTVLGLIEGLLQDYNDNYPHSSLWMRALTSAFTGEIGPRGRHGIRDAQQLSADLARYYR